MSKVTPTSRRKADHIRISLQEDVRSGLTTGLERIRFQHNAIPELDLGQINTQTTFFGKRLRAPILISSMVGGTEEAAALNLALAEAAQATGVAMGLGSMRAAIEDSALAPTFQVRSVAPEILLFANLGAVQLNYGYTHEHCQRAVDMVQADALILHLNTLQEAFQPEGETDFSGLLVKIEEVCRRLSVPVVAKEVGWGIGAEAAESLVEAGVAAIDVAGAGGASWSEVEMHRAKTPRQAKIAAAFRDWGIPTADAVRQVHQALPDTPLIASGGLREGTHIAKCIALGADLGAMATPLLEAASTSAQAVIATIEDAARQFRLCMFATGSKDIAALHTAKLIHTA
ncbi:MAG: type 2 isopentenyl-diphosphate Delta-isomerase [Anaerolineales bacterium]|jgi:isopentenyl-diphosphate delta-isomerase